MLTVLAAAALAVAVAPGHGDVGLPVLSALAAAGWATAGRRLVAGVAAGAVVAGAVIALDVAGPAALSDLSSVLLDGAAALFALVITVVALVAGVPAVVLRARHRAGAAALLVGAVAAWLLLLLSRLAIGVGHSEAVTAVVVGVQALAALALVGVGVALAARTEVPD